MIVPHSGRMDCRRPETFPCFYSGLWFFESFKAVTGALMICSLWVLAVFSLLSIWMCSIQRQILLGNLCRVAGWREEWQKFPLLLRLFPSESREGLGKQTGIQNVLCWTWLIKKFHCQAEVSPKWLKPARNSANCP